ncbi:hypothetical protein B0H63DRAFT_471130 [Podospora didyma]|uniref:Uncharacterized protein n=1 Tax=Podospora didyma TaxID=330526 RepID=A0AAE0NUR5_9PEZI|nr:hypothetical protein B0H63DRAFT_471130 [Podospora didyma]
MSGLFTLDFSSPSIKFIYACKVSETKHITAMPATPSIASSAASIASSQASSASWSENVLPKKYRDPLKLKETLNEIYGEGQYRVKIRGDRFIVALPRPMLEGELEAINKGIYHHY